MQLILFEVLWIGLICLVAWAAGRKARQEVDF
jgi:hypothetical protein